jgi:hypothetical protein
MISHQATRPRGIPKFNSNYTYVVVDMKHNLSVMGDTPYNRFKVYVWIGSRCGTYQAHFESIMDQLNDLRMAKLENKVRVYIEYQYAESFQFFSAFNHFEREADRKRQASVMNKE